VTERTYDFHGVGLAVRAGPDPRTEAAAAAADVRLRHFRAPLHRSDVTVSLTAEAAPSFDGDRARPVYDTPFGPLLYDAAADRLWGDCRGRAWIDLELQAPAGARLGAGLEGWLASHPLLTIALVELLKRHGRFALHAAALAHGEAVVLFPAASGAGKTTLALALLDQGWGFLSDDMVFLQPRPARDRPVVLGFPDEVDVGPGTVELLPTLAAHLGTPAPERLKAPMLVEEAFGVEPVRAGTPVAVVFPRVGDGAASRLQPLDPGDALVELAPNVLLTDGPASQAHLDALAALVRATPCWSLETGQDFAALSGQLRRLVRASAQTVG
jgi:hypothetical protein